MTPLEQQFATLVASPGFEQAEIVAASPTSILCLPRLRLRTGWSKPLTAVRFAIPSGYPFAHPDCFYADADLRLHGGAMPQNTAIQSIPGISDQFLWFSWHPQGWNANRDDLLSYVRLIRTRLEDVR